MSRLPSQPFDELLLKWQARDQQGPEALVPLANRESRTVAHASLKRERPGHTLQITAFLHEVCLRLADQRPLGTENRAHFLGVAARLMRQILVDYARSHRATKRGVARKVALDAALSVPQMPKAGVVALDAALTDLAKVDEQRSRIVELRLFGGLTTEESAEVLGISRSTAKRDWNVANAWLTRQMKRTRRWDVRSSGRKLRKLSV